MLELRPSCEGCGKLLPPDASDAMICTYECTFCEVCALTQLRNVCPNCGGNFQRRPIRRRARSVTMRLSTKRRTRASSNDTAQRRQANADTHQRTARCRHSSPPISPAPAMPLTSRDATRSRPICLR